MKTKLILVAILASAIFSKCKKEEVTPEAAPVTQTNTTNSADQKWNYSWDYKLTGDNTVYSSMSCLTDAEMLTIKQLYNAFNIRKWSTC